MATFPKSHIPGMAHLTEGSFILPESRTVGELNEGIRLYREYVRRLLLEKQEIEEENDILHETLRTFGY